MASLNLQTAALRQPAVLGGNRCEFGNGTVRFVSEGLWTVGTARLDGSSGENVAGWELGFFQLQFVETNYAVYRGRTAGDGSAKVSWSHLRLCRDSLSDSRGNLWYEPRDFSPQRVQGVSRPSVLPDTGRLVMMTGISDAPRQILDTKIRNTGTRQFNFLHHAEVAFHFCTMLAARDPRHQFTFLKHFYWNSRWEARFQPDAAGNAQLVGPLRSALNVQRQVHSGLPNDARFRGHVLSRSLPNSNRVASRPPRIQFSADWNLP